jgi:DNA invertase Pin-like site-specific DNA recombinase
MTTAAIWVSTTNQTTKLLLRAWAGRHELDVVAEQDDTDALLNGARLGEFSVVLVWTIDGLGRGVLDILATLRQLYEYGCDVWSHEEPWLASTEPRERERLVSLLAWIAEQDSARRSEGTKAGMARRRAQGKPMGGAASHRGKDKTPRRTEGYKEAWAPGGARRKAKGTEST